jgi:hypothetical protein
LRHTGQRVIRAGPVPKTKQHGPRRHATAHPDSLARERPCRARRRRCQQPPRPEARSLTNHFITRMPDLRDNP